MAAGPSDGLPVGAEDDDAALHSRRLAPRLHRNLELLEGRVPRQEGGPHAARGEAPGFGHRRRERATQLGRVPRDEFCPDLGPAALDPPHLAHAGDDDHAEQQRRQRGEA